MTCACFNAVLSSKSEICWREFSSSGEVPVRLILPNAGLSDIAFSLRLKHRYKMLSLRNDLIFHYTVFNNNLLSLSAFSQILQNSTAY